MTIRTIGISIDSLDIFDYIFERRLFDQVWLLNRYRVLLSSFVGKRDIEAIQEDKKREYLLKGFNQIPINKTLLIEIGQNGLLPGPQELNWRHWHAIFPGKEWKLANSILEREKLDPIMASKLVGFLASQYFVTNNPHFTKLMETYKEDIQRIRAPLETPYFHPKILSPAGLENLVKELLQDDEYCKYHRPETVRQFSQIM